MNNNLEWDVCPAGQILINYDKLFADNLLKHPLEILESFFLHEINAIFCIFNFPSAIRWIELSNGHFRMHLLMGYKFLIGIIIWRRELNDMSKIVDVWRQTKQQPPNS